jgi:peptidoglycan/LPS O-acetylase OafA/YrhL
MYSRILDWRYGVWAAGLLTMALMLSFQWASISGVALPAAGYLVFGLVCGIWVTGLAGIGNKPVSRLVLWVAPVGQVSYFIYLFHLFTLEAVRRLPMVIPGLELTFWPGFLLSLTVCFVAAKVSWRYFESPLIQYSQRKK